ncbi:unnamed protein product [Rotaria sp. Silwood2]|nr:unnamed protein product [Rotaria sp. Silwood2]
MGNVSTSSVPRLTTHIHTSSGAMFRLFYFDLVDHILLLRQVITHPEMIEKGDKLEFFIQDYCHRMSNNQMMSKRQQSQLPWQIDWIWHVHRLHPIAYYNDCIKQIPGSYFIDKIVRKLTVDEYQKQNGVTSRKPIHNQASFIPSFDMMEAVLRQSDFLEKFVKHNFYSLNLKHMDLISFEQIVENYVSFMKLARKNTMIVPTFEIDLMWHTHMRYPLSYLEFSKALCGFLLDHDDSVASSLLKDAYQDTADRWKLTYHSEYGAAVNQNYSRNFLDISRCASIYKSEERKQTNRGKSGGCGGYLGIVDGGSDNDGSSCGSSCGGGD